VIPHARGLPVALASRALVIPVIQTTFGAVSMATPRAAETVAAGEAGADRTAVDVAAVAGAADREDRLTAGAGGQAARRALSHRLAPTAVAATPRKAPQNVRQSGAGERWPYNDLDSSTEGPERLLRALASFSGAESTRSRGGTRPARWRNRGAAGAKLESRCFAPDAAYGRGPFGPVPTF